MQRSPHDETNAEALSPWRMLIRYHSEKIGTLAEDVVLPKHERVMRRTSRTEDIEMQNVETPDPHTTTVTVEAVEQPQKQPKHFPAFMILISIIQICIMYEYDEQTLLIVFGYDPNRRHEIWRFITLMLVHSSYSHLWPNIIMQLILGVLLEIIHQSKRIAIIYLASVFGGSLSISVLDCTSYTVGASAGVMGLLFSHLSTIILNWNEMDRKCCRLFWLLLYIGFDIGLSIYLGLFSKEDSNTSHAGHIGGAITGFLVSILVLKNFNKHPWEEKMQKICVRILIAVSVTVFVVNITFWNYYLPTEWNFQYENTYLKYLLEIIKKNAELIETCEDEPECKLMLDQYNFNGTLAT